MPELDLEEQLRRYGDAVATLVERGPEGPVPRPSRRQLTALVAAAVVLAIGLLGLVRPFQGDDRMGVTTEGDDRRSAPGVFSERTGSVLLFSDGLGGAMAVDLDRGVLARSRIDGERGGDQPFRLTLTGGALVVGWGDIHALPLGGGPSRLIDRATVYLPAAEPGQVWTLDYEGGRIGVGAVEVRRVDLEGEVVVEAAPFDHDLVTPIIGVPGGLAVATTEGVAVWDADTGEIGEPLGPGQPVFATSDGERLSWCDGDCTTVHTAALERTGPATAQHVASGAAPVVAPGGEHLAVLVDTGAGAELEVIDTATGERTSIAAGLDPVGSVQWSPDGQHLFYASYAYEHPETILGHHRIATGAWEQTTIPAGGGVGFIVLEAVDATRFFPSELTRPEQCGSAAGQGEPCGYQLPAVSEGAAGVETPNLVGLPLEDAQRALTAVGLLGGPVDGDPEDDAAVVVAQAPDPGTRVHDGDAVGLRTALVTPGLCAALRELPATGGDAQQLAARDGFWDALERAAREAPALLARDIANLLAQRNAGEPLSTAPSETIRSLDRVAIHHRACWASRQ